MGGGNRNLPTKGLDLPTRELKWLNMKFLCIILLNFLPQETKISSDRGLDASDRGAVAPSRPTLASSLTSFFPLQNSLAVPFMPNHAPCWYVVQGIKCLKFFMRRLCCTVTQKEIKGHTMKGDYDKAEQVMKHESSSSLNDISQRSHKPHRHHQ